MPSVPRLGCLCVTEDRAPVFGIALSSWLMQSYPNKRLLVVFSSERYKADLPEYTEVVKRAHRKTKKRINIDYISRLGDVPARLDHGCERLFDEGCDLVAVWDDDDAKQDDWLALLAAATPCDALHVAPIVAGATQGWFCNLRSLNGEFLQVPHIWGGSLAFNRLAWEAASGFKNRATPGYDRSLVADIPSPYLKMEVDVGKAAGGHVAFSHGKNVATWLRTAGEPLEKRLKAWYPPLVYSEIKRAQKVMVETRTFPPWSGGN